MGHLVSSSKSSSGRAVLLVTSLFFLWGFALNLNPILIPHLKKACQLTDKQSAFIDSASYLAYFLMAIPAGQFMKRFGYKSGITLGLLLFAGGALLFYPAALSLSYVFFLVALFIIACGLAFLETAANPYITVLGEPATAAQRINFAQSFNGLAATLAPFIGGRFILSGTVLTPQQEAAMSAAGLHTYLTHEAAAVRIPYLVIGIVVLLVAIVLWRTPLPEIMEDYSVQKEGKLLRNRRLMFGVAAQFFYVGAQVCISSFFIRFAGRVAGVDEKSASVVLAGALLGFMLGRFIGTWLMKIVAPAKLLALYSILNIVLVCGAVFMKGYPAVYALAGAEFFMSIMFPTIFSLAISGLGARTKEGSSLVIMSIVGGAIFPVLMGQVSDATSIQTAYLVPALCFIVVLAFALTCFSQKKITMIAGH